MRGAVAGVVLALAASIGWVTAGLVKAWVDGDLDRSFPACDPCGLMGHAARFAIVAAMGFGIVVIPAAVGGWLTGRIATRTRARPR